MDQYKLADSPITYYITGRKHREWLLFLHAAFVTHEMFSAQVEALQDKYNLLLVDMIGHGQSTDTKKGDNIDKMSGWIRRIMEKEGVDQLHVVGVSLGAVLAQDFANHYPDAVRSLACFGGYNINHFDKGMQKENAAAQMGMMFKAVFSVKWFAKANKKISAHTTQAQDDFYQMNLRFKKKSFRYLASLNHMVNQYRTGKRAYPLLIGCGEFDIPAEIAAVKAWQEEEPDSHLVIFKNAGHCANMDVPQEFNRVLEAFWEGRFSVKRHGNP